MAEIAVAVAGSVLTAALLNLSKLLSDYVNFLGDVKDNVKSLQKDLNWMHAFLKDAEKRPDDDSHLIREWVLDVTDLAYEAEDIIETYFLKLNSEDNTDTGQCCICIPFVTKLPIIHELGRQLQDLQAKSKDISKRAKKHRLSDLGSASTAIRMENTKLMELRESSSNCKNEFIFGRDTDIKKLQDELNNESGRFILSIFGMGGLGKTTLVRDLYNKVNESTQGRYHYRVWICVSQSYTHTDLLRRLIKSMTNAGENVSVDLKSRSSMIDYLFVKLKNSTFLVVLDDVWDKDTWEGIKEAFPNKNKNGRVIITTRIQQVAQLPYAFEYELKGLDKKNSWDLFCRKTFQYDTRNPDLKRLAESMVSICGGLPLAIITLAGVLSTKYNNIGDWETVSANIWTELRKQTPLIDAVLSLSFNDLPYPLRSCLLYVAMLPEDFEIPVSKLILLWDAEGLSHENDAKSNFNALVGRSLLQTTSEDWLDSTCHVHDLVRDLAIRKAEEVRFSKFYGEREKFDLSKTQTHTQRRLAMHNMFLDTIPDDYNDSLLRTMQISQSFDSYRLGGYRIGELLRSLHGRFGFLRVLDLKIYGHMPDFQVGKMIHLRYLGLEADAPFEVSDTLGDLKVLQTLYVASEDETVTLPRTVANLHNLKHLIGRFGCRGGMRVCIGKLKGLKTLAITNYTRWCDLDTTNLMNLQNLSMGEIPWKRTRDKKRNSVKFLFNFDSLPGLLTINLGTVSISVSEVSEILRRCRLLTHFKLGCTEGKIASCINPDIFAFGERLKVIQLKICWRMEVFIPSLEKLPRLQALKFYLLNHENQVFTCSEKAFPQLRTLHFASPSGPRSTISMTVPENGMPLLRNLNVNERLDLEVPDKLKGKIIYTRTEKEEFFFFI